MIFILLSKPGKNYEYNKHYFLLGTVGKFNNIYIKLHLKATKSSSLKSYKIFFVFWLLINCFLFPIAEHLHTRRSLSVTWYLCFKYISGIAEIRQFLLIYFILKVQCGGRKLQKVTFMRWLLFTFIFLIQIEYESFMLITQYIIIRKECSECKNTPVAINKF